MQGMFYSLMLQDARIELLAKIQYFIGAFTSCGCKSSKAMPGCSFSSLNCICVGCYSFVLITGGGSWKWLERYFELDSAFQMGICY